MSGLTSDVAKPTLLTDAVEKGFSGGLRATLIQDEHRIRNIDLGN
jgi:hypothetical protein